MNKSLLKILYILGIIFILLPGKAMAIEEPQYEKIKEFENFEIRKYPSMLIAEVFVQGSRNEASNQGFRKIADFIFGNNSGNGKDAKIAMTAPVTVEPLKIEMTVPVTVEPETSEGTWRIEFVMPSKYTLETIPKPKNEEVKLRVMPEKNYAVVRFSGFTTESNILENTQLLQEWMLKEQLKPIGTPPRLARYNPPWTLPFWRRNEILIEVVTP